MFANGDITSVDDARRVLALTGADGVLIGRAALGAPWLPGDIARALSGQSPQPRSSNEVFAIIVAHLVHMHEFYGEELGVRMARKHVKAYMQRLQIRSRTDSCVQRIGDGVRPIAFFLRVRDGRSAQGCGVKRVSAKLRKRAGAKAAGVHGSTANGTAAFVDLDRPLHRCVESALTTYFEALDGEKTSGLFDLVMAEVERPMLGCVMRHVAGNQSRAAEVLGLSRGTLRKKLILHGLLEDD